MLQTLIFRNLIHTAAPALTKSPLAKLRKRTGYSISLCKQALETNEQDIARAEEWLKEQALSQGWAKANKLEGRNAAQGLVGLLVKGQSASMIELNCETDFVARNKQFHELLNEISAVNLQQAPARPGVTPIEREALLQLKSANGQTLADLIALYIGQIGEKIVLRRGLCVTADEGTQVTGVTHPSARDLHSTAVQYGRYGAVMTYSADQSTALLENQTPNDIDVTTRALCQHIIGMNPRKIGDFSQLPPPRSEEEREEKENKRQQEMERIASDPNTPDTREKKKVSSLIEQDFIMDTSQTVGEVLQETGIIIKDFARYEVGQNIEG